MRWLRRKPAWSQATTHDITIQPGGHILHHTSCWCRAEEMRRIERVRRGAA